MSMYVDILSNAVASRTDDWTINELVGYAIVFREAIDNSGAYGQCAADVLAAEIAYDRALICLCELHGIAVDAQAFMHPHEARLSLESHLASVGVDLVEPSYRKGNRVAPHR
ncbi:MAG: hypothetical protein WAM97_03120 [Acidimicrobiales bacterium]